MRQETRGWEIGQEDIKEQRACTLEWSSIWTLGSPRMLPITSGEDTEVRCCHVIDNSAKRNVRWRSLRSYVSNAEFLQEV